MSNDVQSKIKALQEAYGKQLPSKIVELETNWNQVKGGDKSFFETFLRAAHTLHGTAATYGFKEVSEIAEKLETKLRQVDVNQFKNEDIAEITQYIIELKQHVKNLRPKQKEEVFFDFEKENETRSIFILDQDQTLIENQFEKIKQFNYKISVFSNFYIFYRAALEQHPDMLIIDIAFANDLTDEIIKKFRDELAILIYTSKVDDLMSRLTCLRKAGQAFLVKPFEPNVLLRRIDNLFEAKKSHNERILIVDDSETIANYHAALLSYAGLQVRIVTNPQDFLSTLQEFDPDLILMDIYMPFCSGRELAQIVNQQENLSGIPIIFLSTLNEKSKQLEVLSYAGDDFLTKPVEPKFLLAAVRNRLMRSRMLRSQMMRDSLTKLYNHTMIHHQLSRELLIAERYNRNLSVILLDIDHFKSVNDTYGHQVGDVILKNLSFFLQKNIRKSDLIGRYGGEEFLIILPNTDSQMSLIIIDELREKFALMTHNIGEKSIHVTFSGGIAEYPQLQHANDLVKAADQALYKAKEEGRNCIIII